MISPKSMRCLFILYITINDFRSKLFLNFFIKDIPLLTLELALSICFLKLSFS